MNKFFRFLQNLYNLWAVLWGIRSGYSRIEYQNFNEEWVPILSISDWVLASDSMPVRFVFTNGMYAPVWFFGNQNRLQRWVTERAPNINPEAFAALKQHLEKYYGEVDKSMEVAWPWPTREVSDRSDEWEGEDLVPDVYEGEIQLPSGRTGVQVVDSHESNLGGDPGGFVIQE